MTLKQLDSASRTTSSITMLRIIWLLSLATGVFIIVHKILKEATTGCLTIFRRTGPFRACHDTEPFIYFGMTLFGIAIIIILFTLAYLSLKKTNK